MRDIHRNILAGVVDDGPLEMKDERISKKKNSTNKELSQVRILKHTY